MTRKAKSIYSKLKRFSEVHPLPVMVHGDKIATGMYGQTDRIVNPRLSRIRTSIEALRLSAAYSGSYSLSANQLGIANAAFVVHKELMDSTSLAFKEKKWLHPDAFAQQEAMPIPDLEANSKVGVGGSQLLDPADFLTFMNPRVLSETNHHIVDWEYCLSFPGVRCMIKRPQGILVNYIDENCDEQEHKLFDFSARVFLHELDHVEGRTMTHWKISEGNIDIIPGKEDKHRNLMTTVDFYRDKISEIKAQFKDELFTDKRAFDEVEEDGDVWKKFKMPTRKETIEEAFEQLKGTETPVFEETMLLDTIRAMRRDRKELAKQKSKHRRDAPDEQ